MIPMIEYLPLKNDRCQTRTLEIADETIDRLKNNYQSQLTVQSRHVILKIIGWFNNWKLNPQQIGYFMTDVANSGYQNIAISILLTKLSYLRCQRYIYRLIKQYSHHLPFEYTDIVHMVEYMNDDALSAFEQHVRDVHSRKDFNDLIYCHVKDVLDFDEMLDVTNMTELWQHRSATHRFRDVVVAYA